MVLNVYKPLLAALLAAFSFSNLKAQITFVKGYVVSDKGDTLRGEIKINPKKEHENYSKLMFKDASGVQKNYKPAKVNAYGFENNHFVRMNEGEEAVFYKRLTNGAIILYKTAFEVAVMNKVSFEYEYYLFKAGDKKPTVAKEGKFKKQLQEWMKDTPEFADNYIEGDKELNEASAIETINKYNDSKK